MEGDSSVQQVKPARLCSRAVTRHEQLDKSCPSMGWIVLTSDATMQYKVRRLQTTAIPCIQVSEIK